MAAKERRRFKLLRRKTIYSQELAKESHFFETYHFVMCGLGANLKWHDQQKIPLCSQTFKQLKVNNDYTSFSFDQIMKAGGNSFADNNLRFSGKKTREPPYENVKGQ